MPAPPLRDLQRELGALLSAGGCADGEATLIRGAAHLPLADRAPLSGAQRLGIYADMIFVRILDALREDFPATAGALGDEHWEAIAVQYLRAHPTHHPDLRLAGRDLPRFLRTTGPDWLAELAEFELSLTEVFCAADATPLARETVAARPPDTLGDLVLKPIPSCRLLTPQFASDTIRKALLEGEPADPAAQSAAPLLVWRRKHRVLWRRLEDLEYRALAHTHDGPTFAQFCEWLDRQPGAEDPAASAVRLLETWLADELLRATP